MKFNKNIKQGQKIWKKHGTTISWITIVIFAAILILPNAIEGKSWTGDGDRVGSILGNKQDKVERDISDSRIGSLLGNKLKETEALTPLEWIELDSKLNLCQKIGTETLNETAVIGCFQEKDYKKAQKCLNNTLYYNETRPTDGFYTCFDLDGRCTCLESFK